MSSPPGLDDILLRLQRGLKRWWEDAVPVQIVGLVLVIATGLAIATSLSSRPATTTKKRKRSSPKANEQQQQANGGEGSSNGGAQPQGSGTEDGGSLAAYRASRMWILRIAAWFWLIVIVSYACITILEQKGKLPRVATQIFGGQQPAVPDALVHPVERNAAVPIKPEHTMVPEGTADTAGTTEAEAAKTEAKQMDETAAAEAEEAEKQKAAEHFDELAAAAKKKREAEEAAEADLDRKEAEQEAAAEEERRIAEAAELKRKAREAEAAKEVAAQREKEEAEAKAAKAKREMEKEEERKAQVADKAAAKAKEDKEKEARRQEEEERCKAQEAAKAKAAQEKEKETRRQEEEERRKAQEAAKAKAKQEKEEARQRQEEERRNAQAEAAAKAAQEKEEAARRREEAHRAREAAEQEEAVLQDELKAARVQPDSPLCHSEELRVRNTVLAISDAGDLELRRDGSLLWTAEGRWHRKAPVTARFLAAVGADAPGKTAAALGRRTVGVLGSLGRRIGRLGSRADDSSGNEGEEPGLEEQTGSDDSQEEEARTAGQPQTLPRPPCERCFVAVSPSGSITLQEGRRVLWAAAPDANAAGSGGGGGNGNGGEYELCLTEKDVELRRDGQAVWTALGQAAAA